MNDDEDFDRQGYVGVVHNCNDGGIIKIEFKDSFIGSDDDDNDDGGCFLSYLLPGVDCTMKVLPEKEIYPEQEGEYGKKQNQSDH